MEPQADAAFEEKKHVHPDFWMYRPCEIYLDEYSECKSWKARFHQRYINGKETDCSQWKQDYDNCKIFRETKSFEALESILSNEKARREKRINAAKSNTVWEYRTSPPENWASPLPEHLLNNMPGVDLLEDKKKKMCVIS